MSERLIASGADSFNNLAGGTPLPWTVVIDKRAIVNYGEWFFSTSIELQLQVFFSCDFNPLIAKPDTERFINPTQRQYGHWAASTNGFVLEDGRLKYEKQQHNYKGSPIIISNNEATSGITIRRTIASLPDHLQNITTAESCVNVQGAPAKLAGNSVLVKGGLCLASSKGKDEYAQVSNYLFPQRSSLELNLDNYGLPDLMQGVIWPGNSLQVGWTISYYAQAATAVQEPRAVPIASRGGFHPAEETCILGQLTPTPAFCPTGYEANYNSLTGNFDTFSCNQTQP